MKLKQDFVTNSSSASYIAKNLSDEQIKNINKWYSASVSKMTIPADWDGNELYSDGNSFYLQILKRKKLKNLLKMEIFISYCIWIIAIKMY